MWYFSLAESPVILLAAKFTWYYMIQNKNKQPEKGIQRCVEMIISVGVSQQLFQGAERRKENVRNKWENETKWRT